MDLKYKFTDTEIKKLMAENIEIIVDTREQQNQHILDYFNKRKIKYEVKKLDAGDYSIKLTARPEMGLARDCYIPVTIEKKNSIDELAGSFKDRVRFESEFIRAAGSGTKIFLLIEDAAGYENIIKHNYGSEYGPKALLGSLLAFESRYGFTTMFVDKKYSGNRIFYTLRYNLYQFLRN
jgi:ERCC4-type nuclease